MSKPTVAVIFGSRSAEHDVSIVTAISTIIKPLELTHKYHVVAIYISKTGKWYSDERLKDIRYYTSAKIDDLLQKFKPIAVEFSGGMKLVKPGLKNKKQKVDVVFPAMHGTFGEDGDLMGMLEMADVPYVGCGVAASAIAMDKVLARIVAAHEGVPENEYQWFYTFDFNHDPKTILDNLAKLKYPLFVKPTHLGSSIAISKVSNERELIQAIEVAGHYDNKIIVEEAVSNLVEVTVPLLGNDEIIAANTEEPNQGSVFFDFDTKYIREGGAKTKSNNEEGAEQGAQGYSYIPARLNKEMQQSCINIAKNVYKAIGCSGTARVDLLIDIETKKIFFNEVNPLPGSLYAHNWRTVGYSNIDLVNKLVELAFDKYAELQKRETTFKTNFLKQF